MTRPVLSSAELEVLVALVAEGEELLARSAAGGHSYVSRGGMGLQVDFGGDSLHPGMVLGGCRVERGEARPISVDLDVRHTSTAMLPDGRRGVRAGCRFLHLSAEVLQLVEECLASGSGKTEP